MAESRSRRRRLVLLAVLGSGTVLVLRRFRAPEPLEPRAAAQWPPLRAVDSTPAPSSTLVETTDGEALEVQAGAAGTAWVEPHDDGGCPLSHPVKAKMSSGIYHVQDGSLYERTNADRCYVSTDAAEADGFRASKT